MDSPHPATLRRTVLGTAAALGLLTSCSTVEGDPTDAAAQMSGGPSAGLFDDSAVHDIDVTFGESDYDAMIDSFVDSRAKEWITGTVTIDGETFEDVGLRLKGNSSLAGLGGGGPEPADGDVMAGGPSEVRGGPMGSASAEDPESLPWLVRLDENVDGQSYEGVTEFVIRSNGSETSLNEAVALELVGAAGLATQQAAATSLSVNGSDEVLRLVVENPNDAWDEANFDTDGVLYKAESGGDYSYRGEDPASYEDVFDQESDKDAEDLAPLIDFLDFVNNSDDATFASELDDHLDVDAFATYLAAQDLLGNFDDIDGPGNNSYLRYDEETGAFTVVTWDLNLAFGGMGGGRVVDFRGGPGEAPPTALELPDGFEPPDGFDPPDGLEPPPGGTGGPGGGMGGSNNVLVKRFTANEELSALVEQAKDDLAASLYESGLAEKILDRWAALLTEQAADLVDPETVDTEAAAIAEQFVADDAADSSETFPTTIPEPSASAVG